MQDDFLNSHNAAREEVGVAPLTWDEDLAAYAQSYADELANNGAGLKPSGGPYGENLFWGSSTYYTAIDAVDAWVAEKKNYDYESNSCTTGVFNHYTQVVWANTKAVGGGMAVASDDGGVYIVCCYDPPGNCNGEWPY